VQREDCETNFEKGESQRPASALQLKMPGSSVGSQNSTQ